MFFTILKIFLISFGITFLIMFSWLLKDIYFPKKSPTRESFSFGQIKNFPESEKPQTEFFTNSDNLKIAYYKFSPENPKAKLIFIHGGGAHSDLGYFHIGKILKEKFEIETILIDLVGHGKSEGKRGSAKTAKSVYEDISQIIQISKDDKIPFYLGGHSSGSGLILNYLSQNFSENVDGYFFISPEFGYKSETAKDGRIDFGITKTSFFAINAMTFGLLFGENHSVDLNYPKEILEKNPFIVSKLSVNMANSLTPKNPKKQFSKIEKPFAIFVGENDEMFDIKKVLEYENFLENKNEKSFSEVILSENHLSILENIGTNIGETILKWNKKN